MATLLILVSFLATVASFVVSGSSGVRSAFLKASILHGLVIAISTELFSASRAFNVGWVVWLWSLMALVNSLLLVRIWRHTLSPAFTQGLMNLRHHFQQQPFMARLSMLVVGLILGFSLVVAIVAPPNNYDSLTYHMPRVIHWIQNQTVAHYPTPNLRQISFPPFSGYAIAHLYLLADGDYFANMVQWLSFLGCVIGTSLIAHHLHTNESLAALVCATVPMAILQSMTTQNDLVVSYWLVCFAYFVLSSETYSHADWLWLGGSIGLAILTKPTGIIFGAPLVALLGYRVWGGVDQWRNGLRLLQGIAASLVVSLVGLALSLPSYGRNIQTFGNPLGIDGGTRNDWLGLVPLLSNGLKVIALNMPIAGLWNLVRAIHTNILRLDVNDPRTSLINGGAFNPDEVGLWRLYLPVEDFVANPLHQVLLLLALATIAIAMWNQRRSRSPQFANLWQLTMAVVTAFLLYCLLLKWQIWANRLLLPGFMLAAPVIAYWLDHYVVRLWRQIITVVLGLVAIAYSLTALHRPIIPLPLGSIGIYQPGSILTLNRTYLYFNYLGVAGSQQGIYRAYQALVAPVRQQRCAFVSLETSGDTPEYLVSAMLKATGISGVKLSHVNVANESSRLPPEFPPESSCLLLKLG
ncbi:MAG: glycosyltransferase family 39 protein [Cyanobacteria bacterium]|nr:glycosyltransferase family 39 protein [Cyanobacteriota bacterium]MDW8200363.1 glycosyltransferase family 39 protein [Cyanobacteriota bacterium SKYGB_h_bin112]